MKARKLEAWLGGLILGAIVLLALFTQLGPRPGAALRGSIGSVEPEGRRALALLFDRLGLGAEGWRQVPAALPPGAHVVWLARPPGRDVFRRDEPDEPSENRVGIHALEHYAAFVRQGGTLVVAGEDGLCFLRDDLGFAAAEELEIESHGEELRDALLSTGEVVSVRASHAFARLDPGGQAREIATFVPEGSAAQAPFAVELPEGAGRAIVLAEGEFLDNARIGLADHALFAARVCETASRGGRLLLDEYALGLWTSGTAFTVARSPQMLLVSLHALALVLLWAWMHGVPRAFPRDPEPLESFSPVLRARAQARLLERAGRVRLLAPPLRSAALERVARRLRLRLPAASSGARSGEQVAAWLASRVAPAEREQVLDLFSRREVRTRADLERLGRDLAAFDPGVRGPARRDQSSRRGRAGRGLSVEIVRDP